MLCGGEPFEPIHRGSGLYIHSLSLHTLSIISPVPLSLYHCYQQDIHNIELMWDQMFKATVNYGRKGLVIQAISAVDLALWDLLGKLKKEPVYNLIGGKTKNKIPVYATTARPDIAQQLGFVGAKIPLVFDTICPLISVIQHNLQHELHDVHPIPMTFFSHMDPVMENRECKGILIG